MNNTQSSPSNSAPAADACTNPQDAEEVERQLRHIYPRNPHAIEVRHIGYTHIDDILGGLEAGMSCVEIQDATGISNNYVRDVLRGTFLKWQGDKRVPMTGKQQSWAAKIRMMKHPKQKLSVGEPIRRGRRAVAQMTQPRAPHTPAANPKDVAASIAAMYEDRLAELENENKRMREQLLEMHMRLMA